MNAVHDTMSISPVTVQATTSIGDLLALFDRHDFNAFPVVGQHNRLLGIVSKLDVLKLFVAHRALSGDDIATACVADVMQRRAVSVQPRDDIAAAGNLMVVTSLRSLPVTERRGRHSILVGMLSRSDVLRGLRFQIVEGRYARQEKAS
jgi:CBS domain-containing protein